MRKLYIITIFAVILIFLHSNAIYAQDYMVTIQRGVSDKICAQNNTCFSQSELIVCIGSQVTWVNNDTGMKKISSGKVIELNGGYYGKSDNEFQSGMIATGKTFSHEFLKPGIYEYFLVYQPHAMAKIIVKDVCIQNEGKTILSPVKQLKSGIPINDINCKEGMKLILKYNNASPACVTPETKQLLIERGWAKFN